MEREPFGPHPIPALGPPQTKAEWGTIVLGKQERGFSTQKFQVVAAPAWWDKAASRDALPCSLRTVECSKEAGTGK